MSSFTCTNITKRYRHFCLDSISFSMESGYFYVLAGVNGSGKTTLLDCISGVSQGFSGETQIDGISFKASPVLYRQKLGYISEKCPFFMEESVASNGLTYGEFYPDWSVRDYSAYLDRLNVSPSKRIYELSKGEFMKLLLSLLGELLDQDMGILLSTHITEDVDRLADYLLILENGRLVECAPRESLNDKYKEYTGKAAPRIRDLLDLEHTNGTRSKDR